MKILITGGAGYVGSVLVPQLLNKGNKVKVLDNLIYNQSSLLPYFINRDFEFIKGDIRNETIVRQSLKGVDYIVHLASIVGMPACRKNPRLAEEVNVNGTALLNKLRTKSQGIIFASSVSNYGSTEGVCDEKTPPNPLSEYAVTKQNAEKLIIDAGNAVTYRFATAFGLSPRLRLDLLPNDFTFNALKNKSLIVYEKNFRRTFIHVRDMAQAILFALEEFNDLKDAVYNVGSESLNYTKQEVAEAIKEKIDYFLYFADFDDDPDKRNCFISFEKIRSKGFKTSITLEEGIEELIKGFQTVNIRNPYTNIE